MSIRSAARMRILDLSPCELPPRCGFQRSSSMTALQTPFQLAAFDSLEEPAAELCTVASVPASQTPDSSSKLVKIRPLDSGSFAEVHLVRHQDGRLLAFKQIKRSKDLSAEAHIEATIQEAKAEAALHESLNHPNVVKFEEFYIGAEVGMFLEYCSGGSLKSQLEACASACRGPSSKKQKLEPLVQQLRHWPARLELLRQAADGVSYLHSLSDGAVLHNDLRADNMLLHIGDDGSHTLKLADFGLALKVPADAEKQGSGCVRVPSRHVTNRRWVAPEVIAHASDDGDVSLSPATDVYSLAAVMVEVLTALAPHEPHLDEACRELSQKFRDLHEYFCGRELEAAAKEGKPHLLSFPEPSMRLPCPKGGVECAEPLRGVFEACCVVHITTDQDGQPQIAPLPEQRRPSADKLSAALASWPDCSLSCA